ncbi:MAG: ATP synthase F1 subunit delta [Ignavibacteria bacterium]|nr:ATP synthase F1 subunit delta [Ignavibacteria bacterium]
MSVFKISYRYANSFFQIALEKKSLKKYAENINLIFNTLQKSKELRIVLKTPVIKQKDKKNILGKIFGKKIGSETLEFIEFIVDKNREDILFEIAKEFLVLCDQHEGIIRTKISSAIELKDTIKKQMVSKLEKETNKKVDPEFSIDGELIGGFIVKIEDKVMDASVKHQLKLLRKKFSEEFSFSNN